MTVEERFQDCLQNYRLIGSVSCFILKTGGIKCLKTEDVVNTQPLCLCVSADMMKLLTEHRLCCVTVALVPHQTSHLCGSEVDAEPLVLWFGK